MQSSKLTLFTPGPTKVPPIVRQYLAEPPCSYHRQPGFRTMFAENESDLKQLIGIRKPEEWFVTFATTTGTGANDICLYAVDRLGKGLILRNGYFGDRLAKQATQAGISHAVHDSSPISPLDPVAVDVALDAHPDVTWVYFVTHETRAGLKNPSSEIAAVCKRRGLIVAADVVSSAFAYPLDLEAGPIDLAAGSSSKAIQAVPGIGMIFTRNEAIERLRAANPCRNSYLDLVAEHDKQRTDREPRFGQPVPLHAALRAACIHLKEVGVDTHHRRIRRQMEDLVAHLDRLGATAHIKPAYRSWTVMNFNLPPGITCSEFSRGVEAEGFYLLYGIGGDPNQFQISTMGDLSDEDIAGLKRAFTHILGKHAPAGVTAAAPERVARHAH